MHTVCLALLGLRSLEINLNDHPYGPYDPAIAIPTALIISHLTCLHLKSSYVYLQTLAHVLARTPYLGELRYEIKTNGLVAPELPNSIVYRGRDFITALR